MQGGFLFCTMGCPWNLGCMKIYRLYVAPAQMRSEMEDMTDHENRLRRRFPNAGRLLET